MPCYRLKDQDPIESEITAMDRYILGDVRDDGTGLIPTHQTALSMLGLFDRSPREFELIYCRSVKEGGEEHILGPVGGRLGFDVAGLGGDFWSIVADMPTEGRVARFGEKLNENGLFDNASDARECMVEYQRLKLPDFDSPFCRFRSAQGGMMPLVSSGSLAVGHRLLVGVCSQTT